MRERAEALSAQSPVWAGRRWAVSDFWFDQSAAFAEAWLPPERLPAFHDRFDALRPTVPSPRLIVLLDGPAGQLLDRVQRRGRTCERRLTVDHLERIRAAIVRQAGRPGLGPVLRVAAADRDAALAEVLAAVRAME